MNRKQLTRQLRELIGRKPEIRQPGRLVAHLLNELCITGDSQQRRSAMIEKILAELEEAGEIRLYRSGNVLNGYIATLCATDTQVVSEPTPDMIPTDHDQESEVVSMSAPMTRAELVTLALNALQQHADGEGRLHVRSSGEVIARELDISPGEARELNRSLRQLGLRTSPRGQNPKGARPHWVSTALDEVTEEMLAGLSSSVSHLPDSETLPTDGPSVETQDGTAHGDVEPRLLEIISSLEAQIADLQANAEASNQLAEIVADLEARLRERDEVMKQATVELDRKSDEIDHLQAGLRSSETRIYELTTQIESLQAQLAKRGTPSQAALDTLARYGKR